MFAASVRTPEVESKTTGAARGGSLALTRIVTPRSKQMLRHASGNMAAFADRSEGAAPFLRQPDNVRC
jgi:hypothetical protein